MPERRAPCPRKSGWRTTGSRSLWRIRIDDSHLPMIHIFRSLEEAWGIFGPSALSIGNFDGVHAGHRRILRRVAELARENGWKPSVLTFDPHPTKVVAPARSPKLITTPEQRCLLMEEEGIRQALILPFTPELSQIPPEQ